MSSGFGHLESEATQTHAQTQTLEAADSVSGPKNRLPSKQSLVCLGSSFRPTQAPDAYSSKQRTCRGQSSFIHGQRWRLELRFSENEKETGPAAQSLPYHSTTNSLPFSFAYTTLVTRGYPASCPVQRQEASEVGGISQKDYIRNCSHRSGGTATVHPVKHRYRRIERWSSANKSVLHRRSIEGREAFGNARARTIPAASFA